MEVWGGRAGASRGAACRGYRAGQPWGIVYGDDLERKSAEGELLDRVERTKPKCIIPGPPCAIWSHLQNLVYKGDQAELRKAHIKELPTLDLVERIFNVQRAAGPEAVIEHPWLAQSWKELPWRRLRPLGGAVEFETDVCARDPKCPDAGQLARKPTKLLATRAALEGRGGWKCTGYHDRVELMGMKSGISGGQVYAEKFTKRIVDAREEIADQSCQAMPVEIVDDDSDAPEEEPLGVRAITFGEKAGVLPLEVRAKLRRLGPGPSALWSRGRPRQGG